MAEFNCPNQNKPVCALDSDHDAAWKAYCKETAGNSRDCWCDLPAYVQRRYLRQIRGVRFADQGLEERQHGR